MDDSESLDYVSSVDPYQAEKDKPSVDAADEKALVRLVCMVEQEIDTFHTLSGMKRFNMTKFNAEQREAMCDEHVKLLRQFKQKAANAIDGIEEKTNG